MRERGMRREEGRMDGRGPWLYGLPGGRAGRPVDRRADKAAAWPLETSAGRADKRPSPDGAVGGVRRRAFWRRRCSRHACEMQGRSRPDQKGVRRRHTAEEQGWPIVWGPGRLGRQATARVARQKGGAAATAACKQRRPAPLMVVRRSVVEGGWPAAVWRIVPARSEVSSARSLHVSHRSARPL